MGESSWSLWSSKCGKEHGEKSPILASQEIPKKFPNVNGTSQSAAHVQSVDVFGGSRRDNAFQLLAGRSLCSEITPGADGEKKRRRRKPARNGRAGLQANETVNSAKKKASRRDCCFTKSKTPHMKSDEEQEDQKNMSHL